MALLEVNDLEVYYGLIKALKGVSFKVDKGSIVALIGANGAGKTTIMQTISGLNEAKKGSIKFNGVELTKIKPHNIVTMGVSQVPEGRRIFQDLSVKDNLMLGAYTRHDKAEIKNTLEMIYEKFPILKERSKQAGGTLSGGEQQMLAVGRALMAHPSLLLLDEPSMGLSPLYVKEIFKTIKEINKQGTTILLVEQNAKMALSIADYCYVIETGSIVLEGKASDMLNNDKVKKAYLGS